MQNNTTSTSAYICLGSNKGDSKRTMESVVNFLQEAEGLHVCALSPLYYTEPQGYKDQAWFCNQVLRVQCAPEWTAQKLLRFCLQLEDMLGRTRIEDMALRFGPRVIDIDLLLFGHEQDQDPFCTLPHPRMLERAFVLIPLRQVLEKDTLLTHLDVEQALQKLTYRLEDDKIYQ